MQNETRNDLSFCILHSAFCIPPEDGDMAGPALTLREIHRLRRHARELQDRIEQGPRQVKLQHAKAAKQEELLKEAQDAIKHLKVATHEKEVSVKTTQQLIKKYEKQLEEITNKKEYESLRSEIATAHKHVKALEEEILGVMQETEERVAKLPEADKAVKDARAEAAKYEAESKDRLERMTEEYRRTMQTLGEVEATLPEGPVREQYQRQVKARGEDCLSRVESNICTACYTAITAQQANDLSQANFVVCKNCGRILYGSA
jgi:uncharacterized protein